MKAARWLLIPALLVMLANGCSSCRQAQKPAEPYQSPNPTGDRALLLGTGAIQLGPGLGKNAYRWQGDGQWGF